MEDPEISMRHYEDPKRAMAVFRKYMGDLYSRGLRPEAIVVVGEKRTADGLDVALDRLLGNWHAAHSVGNRRAIRDDEDANGGMSNAIGYLEDSD